MRMRAAAIAFCLLAGVAGAGEMPRRFLKFDVADLGAAGYVWQWREAYALTSTRLVTVTFTMDRYRFGTSLADTYWAQDEWGADAVLPLELGYTLWSHPVKVVGPTYLWFPDVYAEASLCPWTVSRDSTLSGRVSVCADVDYAGIGLRAYVGLAANQHPVGDWYVVTPCVGLQLRLLTFGVGF
jgi:hypothetical protein